MKVEFKNEIISKHIKRIYGLGDACMYLVEGSNKALLIDTAYGVGDLKGYIKSLIKTPYEVVITHGHADHVNGIGQFDKVHMNLLDKDLYAIKKDKELRKTMLKRTVENIDEYDEEFIGDFKGEFIDIKEDEIFDLGDIHVRAIHVPGHTQGIMALLVEEEKILLLGDGCGVFTFLFKPESSTVLEYKNTLYKLKKMDNLYDRVLRQHGTCESPKSIIDENLEVADLILEGKDDHIPFEYLGEKVWIAKQTDPKTNKRIDGKNGNIVYSMMKIK